MSQLQKRVVVDFPFFFSNFHIIEMRDPDRQKNVQGIRKWNVFFESAPVAKLLNILTGSDVFYKSKIIYFDIKALPLHTR